MNSFFFGLMVRLGLAIACPVCKTEPPEYWMGGRAKKYFNDCCGTGCWRRSKAYHDGLNIDGSKKIISEKKRIKERDSFLFGRKKKDS